MSKHKFVVIIPLPCMPMLFPVDVSAFGTPDFFLSCILPRLIPSSCGAMKVSF